MKTIILQDVNSSILSRLPSCVKVTKSKGGKPSEPWYTVEAFHRVPFDSQAYSPFTRGFGLVKAGNAEFVLSSDLERAFVSCVLGLEEEREAFGLDILNSMEKDWYEALKFAQSYHNPA